MDKNQLVQHLGLEKHIEGGYFRRTYESADKIPRGNSSRHLLTSIYYLLSDDSPIGHMHKNSSDIIHYFHLGEAVKYYLISPQGELQTVILGQALNRGEQLQLLVPGGYWKASQLVSHSNAGEYALISEAVSPGFDYHDMQLASKQQMHKDFPHLFAQIKGLIKT